MTLPFFFHKKPKNPETAAPATDRADSRLLVGLDVGGTKIQALAVDEYGYLHASLRRAMDAASGEAAVGSIFSTVRSTLEETGAAPGELAAIGLGVPGQIVDGVVQHAVNLKLVSYPLASRMADAFGVPVLIENDVRSAAVGAYHLLSVSRPVGSLAYLSIGTGISSGIILNGSLYRGSHSMAGEIGHVIADPGGRLCKCGVRGCLETIASGPALAFEAARLVQAGRESSLKARLPITAEDVYRAARQGDPVACSVILRASRYLARAVHGLLMAYDVELVAIGGGVSHAGTAFLDPLLEALQELARRSSLARSMLPAGRIMLLPAGFDAGAWGAVFLAQQALRDASL